MRKPQPLEKQWESVMHLLCDSDCQGRCNICPETLAQETLTELATLRSQLGRANRIIGWMSPYVGSMCPPENGLNELNEHCCDNDVPIKAERGAPLKQSTVAIRALSPTTPAQGIKPE